MYLHRETNIYLWLMKSLRRINIHRGGSNIRRIKYLLRETNMQREKIDTFLHLQFGRGFVSIKVIL